MNYRDEDDIFEEDIVFDQAGLLSTARKRGKSAIRRVSSGRCAMLSKTLALFGAFFGLGLTIALPGPATPMPPTDIDNGTQRGGEEYVYRCLGFMLGSMLGGMLLDRFNRLFLVFLALLMCAILVAMVPWTGIKWLLRSDLILLGATIGFLLCGGNVLCLDLWGQNSGPFMQALHFSFSLGAFLALLIVHSTPMSTGVTATTASPMPGLHRLPREANDNFLGIAEGVFVPNSEPENIILPSAVPSDTVNSTANHSLPLLKNTFPNLNASVTKDNSTIPTNSTRSTTASPVPHSSHRTPKPKPQVNDGSKLGKSKDWEKFRQPPAEDLLPVSSTKALTSSTPATLTVNNSISSTTVAANKNASASKTESAAYTKQTLVTADFNNTGIKNASSNSTADSIVPSSTTSSVPISRILQNLPYSKDSNMTAEVNISKTALSEDKHRSEVKISNIFDTNKDSPDTEKLVPTLMSIKEPDVASSTSSSSSTSPFSSPKSFLENTTPSSSSATSTPISSTKSATSTVASTPPPATSSQPEPPKLLTSKIEPEQERKNESEKKKLESGESKVIPDEKTELDKNTASKLETFSKLAPSSTLSTAFPKASTTPSFTPTNSAATKQLPNEKQSDVTSPARKHHSKPTSYDNDKEEIHTALDDVAETLSQEYGLTREQVSSLLIALLLFIVSLLFLGFLCFNPRDPRSRSEDDVGGGRSNIVRPRWVRILLTTLMMFVLVLSAGVQSTYGQLLVLFAMRSPLSLSLSTGTALTATFWGAATSTRLACILVASALSPGSLLVISVALTAAATWLLSALAVQSAAALWVGAVLVAVGTASVLPSSFLWMQQHVHVSHHVAGMLVMGPAMGEMLFPPLALHIVKSIGPAGLLHLPALLSLTVIALWAAAWRLARHPCSSLCAHADPAAHTYQLASQMDEDDLLDLTMSPVTHRNHPRGPTRGPTRGHTRSQANASAARPSSVHANGNGVYRNNT